MDSHQEEEEEEQLLLEENGLLEDTKSRQYTGDGSVDIDGNPVLRHNTGNWRACPFILGTVLSAVSVWPITGLLKTWLLILLVNYTKEMSAARDVATWQGTCYVSPLIGAVLADACWGRYRTIAVFATIYFIGMGTLTLSAAVPAFRPPACAGSICPEATQLQQIIFFLGLYVIALGTGGIKPCVSSFGADQFDDTDPVERVKRGSFFNWFYFSINIGAFISSTFLVWVQDNIGWSVGFAIPTLFMALAVGSFFSGTRLYRFQNPRGSPLTRTCQVLVASFRKWNIKIPDDSSLLYELSENPSLVNGSHKLEHSEEYKFLDKASVVSDLENKSEGFYNPWMLCTVTQVEEVKILLRMFPIWVSGIVFSAVYGQMATVFVEQGMMMDTAISSFPIPPASLSSFDVISVFIWVPIYDRLLVPLTRKLTGNAKGFSELQRIGIGLGISIVSMVAAALLERKRLELARELDLVDHKVAIPISILWQIPQYFFVGAAEVFTFIGQLEFFYDQSPDSMRTLCSALSLLTSALGSYLNSIVLTIVTVITTRGGKPGWIPNNLNQGHLDYYFWLLAVLSFLNLLVYVSSATRYKCKMPS